MGEPLERRSVEGELIEVVPRPALAQALDLLPHPEGGWYRRTWTSPVTVSLGDGDGDGDGDGGARVRPTATLVLFLLPAGEVSAWHRVASPEVWVWNGLGPVRLQLGGSGPAPTGGAEGELLLDAPDRGGRVQAAVPAGVWQRTLPGERDALVSCLVSPGFDFADFTLAPVSRRPAPPGGRPTPPS